jgi:hypothetical protein
VAWESSHVVAWGDVMIRLYSALKIEASADVVIKMHGKAKSIKGGIRIKAAVVKTALQWCRYWGAEVKNRIATVYKGVNADCKSERGATYLPGTSTVAPDWDGGKAECGGGLHFSPHPAMTREFFSDPKKFIACAVALKDMRLPKADDTYPQKIKATRCKNLHEVDGMGQKIGNLRKAGAK